MASNDAARSLFHASTSCWHGGTCCGKRNIAHCAGCCCWPYSFGTIYHNSSQPHDIGTVQHCTPIQCGNSTSIWDKRAVELFTPGIQYTAVASTNIQHANGPNCCSSWSSSQHDRQHAKS